MRMSATRRREGIARGGRGESEGSGYGVYGGTRDDGGKEGEERCRAEMMKRRYK